MKIIILLDGGRIGQQEAERIKGRFSNILMDREDGLIKIIVPEANTSLAELVLKWWDESDAYISVTLEKEDS